MYIKKNVKDFNTTIDAPDLIICLCYKKISNELKEFIKTVPGLDRNFLKKKFIDTLKNDISKYQAYSIRSITYIVSNKEYFENILLCLDINHEIISKLLENYKKSDSLNEIIQYLESITVTIR